MEVPVFMREYGTGLYSAEVYYLDYSRDSLSYHHTYHIHVHIVLDEWM